MHANLARAAIIVLPIVSVTAVAWAKDKHPENYNTTITFSEFADGSQIKNQYEPYGIKFGGSGPFIADDASNPTSPVLSGTPQFAGDITGKFIDQKGNPVTVHSFALDAGVFDNKHSTELEWYDKDGTKLGSMKNTNDDDKIQRFVVTDKDHGIAHWKIKPVGEEQAGFGIDNVSFNAPEIECKGGPKNLIEQYKKHKIDLHPLCGDPTKTAHSASYTFDQLNVDGTKYALIRAPLVAPASGGFGVDAWAGNLPTRHKITLGYLTPDGNVTLAGGPENRHMFGDAADLENPGGKEHHAKDIAAAATTAGADFVEQNDAKGDCQLQCVHADWRFHSGPFVQ